MAALAVVPPAAAITTTTFSYTGAQQQFVVPAGVTSVHVLAVGARGGNGIGAGGGLGGLGAEVSGQLEVIPGQTLYVEVGGAGTDASFAGIAAAFNGGSFGGQGTGGGGGASDVRLQPRSEPDSTPSLFSRLIVAGAEGGGGAGIEGATGGAGGNAESEGASATGAVGGGAGNQERGGVGACPKFDCDGNLGSGHEGSVGSAGSAGGGGGGGLFGGAGGTTNATNTGAGGGGGSSLQPAGGKTVVPAALGAPEVQVSYTPPAPVVGRPEPPPPGPPSNGFTLLRPVVGADGSITLVLDIEGPGTLGAVAKGSYTLTATRHGKRTRRKVHFTYGTARVSRQQGGVLEMTIRQSVAGRKALRAHKRLPVSIAVTFAPIGANAATKRVNATLTRR